MMFMLRLKQKSKSSPSSFCNFHFLHLTFAKWIVSYFLLLQCVLELQNELQQKYKNSGPFLRVEAWGSVGHRTIANLALSYISEETRGQINKYTQVMNITSLVEIADWADSFSRHHQNKWSVDCHFLECYDEHLTDEECYEDWEKICRKGCCITDAISNYTGILEARFYNTKYGYHYRNGSTENFLHSQARYQLDHYGHKYNNNDMSFYQFTADPLKFLIHYLGDIHQPFHVSFSDNAGGNFVKLHFFNQSTTIHSLWDQGMINYWEMTNEGGCVEKDPIYKDECNGWKELSASIKKKYLSGPEGQANIEKWRKETNQWNWAKETHQLVHEAYYDYAPYLGEEYYSVHIDTLFEQLAKAGIRLAYRLDTIYSQSDSYSSKYYKEKRKK